MDTTVVPEKARLMVILDVFIAILAIGLVGYEVIGIFLQPLPPVVHLNTFLILALLLVFFPDLQKTMKEGRTVLSIVLSVFIVLSLIGAVYVYLFYEQMQQRIGFTTTSDIVIGIIILLVLFEAARRSFGIVVVIIVVSFLAYAFLSSYLPPPFYQPAFSLVRLISWLVTGLTEGVYGSLLAQAANIIFMFIIFGSVLEMTHAQELFTQIGLLVGSKMRGGAAQTSVVSSALFGTISGSGVANVVVDGCFTIPTMKKAGFKPEMAGAVEAIASTGGALMPPVMGTIAFVMSGVTGIPYARICLLAVIPALVYYLSIAWAVHLHASKQGIPYTKDPVDTRYLMSRLHIFVVPFGIITALLIMDFSPRYAAGWAIISALAVSFFRKETRPGVRSSIPILRKGAITAAGMGVSLALLGTTLAVLEITGVGNALTSVVEAWSQGFLPLALIIIMIMNIILGCLAPGFTTYLILAMTTAPLLRKLGLTLEQAHMFILYYAIMGLVTPPVGPAALVAAGIAQASYWKTGWRAMQLGLGALLMPFFFVYQPALLARFSGPLITGITSIVVSLLAIALLQALVERYLFTHFSLAEGVLTIISTLGLMAYIFTKGNWIPLVVGVVCLLWLLLSQRSKVRAVAVRLSGNELPEETHI